MARKPKLDRFLSVAEVADLIGLDEATIRNGQCETDELIRVKLGSRIVFSLNNVQAWINRKVREARDDQRAREAEQSRHNQLNKDGVLRIIK